MRVRTTQRTVGKYSTQQQGQLEPFEVVELPAHEEFRLVGEEEGHFIVELRIFKGHAETVEGDRTVVGRRRINQAGLELIKVSEGRKLKAYRCPRGKPTIGYGSTDGVVMGMVITEQQAEALLEKDLERFEKGVNALVKVDITGNQFAALVSLAFNVGMGDFEDSTLLRKLNAGDYVGAAEQFPLWIWAGDRILPGLVERRRKEKLLFETGIK